MLIEEMISPKRVHHYSDAGMMIRQLRRTGYTQMQLTESHADGRMRKLTYLFQNQRKWKKVNPIKLYFYQKYELNKKVILSGKEGDNRI